MNKKFQIVVVSTLVLAIGVFLPMAPAIAVADKTASETVKEEVDTTVTPQLQNYQILMRNISEINEEKADNKQEVITALEEFIANEKENNVVSEASYFQERRYFNQLEEQLRLLTDEPESNYKKTINWIKNIFGINKSNQSDPGEVKIPENPASFDFDETPVELIGFQESKGKAAAGTDSKYTPDYLPVYEDVIEDEGNVVFSNEIYKIAQDLEFNPVRITNYVRENVTYEPYFGSKKGALGCLDEMICNDVDTSSLLISLLRASEIPARYKKNLAMMPVEDLQSMLGVENTQAAYAALHWNEVPAYIINWQPGDEFETYDFTQDTHLVVEWVSVESFIEYDENGAYVSNNVSFRDAQDTDDVRDVLDDFPKKQWLAIDATYKPHTKMNNEIVVDTAGFDTEVFWYDFLQFQGDMSPYEKFRDDLLTATQKDILDPNFHSYNEYSGKEYEIIPPKLPYILAVSDDVVAETWSEIPDRLQYKIKVSLFENQTNEIFSEELNSYEINNKEFSVDYQGATPTDEAIIESYGGIHATPATLVDIVPVLSSQNNKLIGSDAITIGDGLILQFELMLGNDIMHTDEKFSVAGNSEGVYISMSKIQEDPELVGREEVALRGNIGIAREYLLNVQQDADLTAKSLNYQYNLHYTRAVVTQNRILSEVGGYPTTFDYKGLSIDSVAYIVDYSGIGSYDNHKKDFRLMYGLNASYLEGDTFTDITGMSGISTVKGLQYAYNDPTYTVHIIDTANESVIDTLQISANTKQNMHDDVQDGNTIITPDQFIQDNAWEGLVYISLEPYWTGMYAIGEQVQNGGWTTDFVASEEYCYGKSSTCDTYWSYFNPALRQYFIHQDEILSAYSCVYNETLITEFESMGWSQEYGAPCYGSNTSVDFGDQHHEYALATNGMMFNGSGEEIYSGWEYGTTVYNNMVTYYNNIPNRVSKNGQKFSTILGTLIWYISTDDGDETMYYTPINNGEVFRLNEDFRDKAADDNNEAIKKLGWPTSERQTATRSDIFTGFYQDFINGQMYRANLSLPRATGHYNTYTYGEITKEHNNLNGTWGELGFPTDDPRELGDYVYQKFENDKEIGWNKISGIASATDVRKYRCEVDGNIDSTILLKLIMLHGFLDTAFNTVEDLGELTAAVANLVWNYDETAVAIVDFLDDFSYQKAKEIAGGVYNATIENLKEELDAAYCPARQHYLSGRLAGEIALFLVPAAKIKAATKLKIATRLDIDFPSIKRIVPLEKFMKKLEIPDTDVTEWNRVKALTDPNARGTEGKTFWRGYLESNDLIDEFDVPGGTPLGGRRVDIYDNNNGAAYEVKNYGSNNVNLDADIKLEVDKDVYLMNEKTNYRPVWVFVDRGPSGPLKGYLQKHGIETMQLTN